MQRVAHTPDALSEAARKALDHDGALYVTGVGQEDDLLGLAAALGEIVTPGVGMGAGMHDGKLYSVKVRDGGRGRVDEHGHVILSTTHREFPLHTDAYNRAQPPRFVLLLRSDDGPDDTPSHVSDAVTALADAPDDLLQVLSEPLFPSALGPLRLLERTATGSSRLRFNEEETARWGEREDVNPPLEPRARQALAALGERLRAARDTFTIAPHDCLVLDNWRSCHGRSAMTPGSTRVLQRAWVA
jgi:alpha-ketoglutarate-dependent taurine dioxygenase